MVATRPTAMDRRATATHTVAAARTRPDKARPTIALTAPARHTMKAEARLTRTTMAAKRRVNTAKGRRTQIPTAARRRLNTEMAPPIRMFMEGPLRRLTEKARTTPARMGTAPLIIHLLLIMAIIRLPRSTTTDQHAPTATVGRLPLLSQRPLLLVRLSLQQMQTLPTLMPMLRPRQPTLTTPDTTPAQPQLRRVNPPRPRQPWLRHQEAIPWDRWLRRSRPVALHPPFKARPTTCVGIPGSARRMVQTGSTTGW